MNNTSITKTKFNMKKNSYILTLLFMLTSTIAMAQWRTPADAYAVLEKYANTGQIPKKQRVKCKMALNKAKLLHTVKMDGHNTIYVVDNGNGGGVTLVSGFEGEDILGYTDRGNFCIDSIPPALKEMMDSYSRQMVAAAKTWTGEKRNARLDANRAARQPIDHLIQTKWEQYEPYNNLCPNDYPTGCVATCLAQIMKYYNYPKHGTGSYSYTWNGQTLSANFGATEYKWEEMLDRYNEECYSQESANAVATLMSHVGIAANMNYQKGGSGAVMKPEILTKYFDYNKSATRISITGTDEDIDILYKQLEKRQPIPYSGESSVSGHAFIVDGYRDGLWGINWGWKGYCDGYFKLGAFNPTDKEKYNYSNKAIINLTPNGSYTADKGGKDGEFTVTSPGSLRNMLGKNRYKKLTIHGNINGEDLRELLSRCSSEDYKYIPLAHGLTSLDLSDANLLAGGVYRLEKSYSSQPAKYWDCIAKKDTLSWGAFRYSDLEELLLPSSIKDIETQAIEGNDRLNRLQLPSQLESYENYAVTFSNPDITIEVANGAKPIIENNALYLKGHKKLCIVTGKHDTFKVNKNCREIDNGAFSNAGCETGTLIVPQLENELSLGYQNIEKLWVAGNIDKGLHIQNIYKDIHLDLYLPSQQMVSVNNKCNNDNYIRNIYVPQKLMAEYLADANWSTYKSCFKAIDNENVCVDDSHIGLMPEKTMLQYEKFKLTPLVYDTNLTKANATWSSSNNDIATVDSEGNVTAKSHGTADITVSTNGYKATCRITVNEWPTIHVEQPGTLANLLKNTDYGYFAVTGNINGNDFKELHSRFSCHYQDKYTSEGKRTINGLNLRDANIVEGGVYDEESNYTCKANTLSRFMFSTGSTIKVLILPKSVTKMESYCITTCDNLQVLKLPECLAKYEDNAIDLDYQKYDIDIDVPESSCVTMKDGLLYEKDFSRLHLCLVKKPTVIIDSRCKGIDSYAFYAYNYDFETIVAPEVTSYYVNGGYKVKNIWLGNTYNTSPYSISNSELTVFLPAKRMTILDSAADNKSCKKILVPKALIDTYKADANWSKHAKSIEAIEDCGIVLDECRVLMPESIEMMQNGFGSITPQMLDTRLMKEQTTMTSSCQRAVSINSSNELMSFCPGEADITVQVGDVTKTCHVTVLEYPTVNVEQPGTFSSIIGENTYKYLRVTGNINGEDLKQIRFLCNAADINTDSYFKGTNDNPVLEYLDLKDAKLTEGGEYASFWGNPYYQHEDELPMYMFACSHLQQLRLPVKANKTGYYTRIMKYNRYMKYIELPEDLPRLSANTISECSALKAIIYRGKQLLQADTSDELTEFKDVTLYVRRSLLASFRNNSVYANAFKSIEPLEDEILDGIESIEAERDNATQNAIYNIMGQRIPTLMKGINIVNGKKVLIEK